LLVIFVVLVSSKVSFYFADAALSSVNNFHHCTDGMWRIFVL
jgi:hypothetical protein